MLVPELSEGHPVNVGNPKDRVAAGMVNGEAVFLLRTKVSLPAIA